MTRVNPGRVNPGVYSDLPNRATDTTTLRQCPGSAQATQQSGMRLLTRSARRGNPPYTREGAFSNRTITRASNYSGASNPGITTSPTRAHKGRNGDPL
jgi:hypothetical protein